MPFGPRKSGMPLAVDTPAPVNTRMRCAARICPTRFASISWSIICVSGDASMSVQDDSAATIMLAVLRTTLGLLLLLVPAADSSAQAPGLQVPAAPAIDVGFEPSPMAVADAMLEFAGVKADDVVYDLGSGDG